MEDPKEFFKENIKYILMVVLIFFSLLTIFPNLGNNIETFNLNKLAGGGCKSLQNNPPKLNKWCRKLSKKVRCLAHLYLQMLELYMSLLNTSLLLKGFSLLKALLNYQ